VVILKKKVTLTIDEDLADAFPKENYSMLLNDTLRSMATTDKNIPYYANQIQELRYKLQTNQEERGRIDVIVDAYQNKLATLELQAGEIEKQLIASESQYEACLSSDRKTQLLKEIRRAIVYNEYIKSDIEIAVATQLEEIKKLIPSFDLDRQIIMIRDA
jgi:hypothetical protein